MIQERQCIVEQGKGSSYPFPVKRFIARLGKPDDISHIDEPERFISKGGMQSILVKVVKHFFFGKGDHLRFTDGESLPCAVKPIEVDLRVIRRAIRVESVSRSCRR